MYLFARFECFRNYQIMSITWTISRREVSEISFSSHSFKIWVVFRFSWASQLFRELMKRRIVAPYLQSVWFSESRNFYFELVQRWCWFCQFWNHTLRTALLLYSEMSHYPWTKLVHGSAPYLKDTCFPTSVFVPAT